MTRVFFDRELDTVATFWRIYRKDGVTLAFTTHDRDIWLDGMLHHAAPGMVPSAIRETAGFDDDGAEVNGALSHDLISAEDLEAGRYDAARIVIGAQDWESGDNAILYRGTIDGISREAGGFTAQLKSRKAELSVDPIPRTSPTCRARFCDLGCGLSAARFTRRAVVSDVDFETNALRLNGLDPAPFAHGELRWLDGPHIGGRSGLLPRTDDALLLEQPLPETVRDGDRIELREGCDHRVETCADRFGNAVNFQGEPYLPGNDLLAQYPVPR